MTPRLASLCWLCLFFPLVPQASGQEAEPRAVPVADVAAAEPPATDATPVAHGEVLSRSRQFRISGSDGLVRGTIAMLAEEAKDELLKLTGEKDEWKLQVRIRLHGKQGDPPPRRSTMFQLIDVGGARELRLDIHLGRGIGHEPLKHAITRALIYERALQHGVDPADDTKLKVPAWLAEGLREATAWRLDQSDRRLYQALFKQGGLFRVGDLFATGDDAFEEMDGATRAAFRVSSGALVMALLEQPEGRSHFRDFLREAPAFEGETPALLARHFPDLNLSETSLAKWWTLQLANKGGLNQAGDVLGIAETETALAEALRLNFRTPEGIIQQKDLAAWPELATLKDPERIAAVRAAQDALVRLSYRCFPSYRPLIADYQQVLAAIARNKLREVPQRLKSLEETRATMKARATRARDYLDWFEISNARETSGVFDDYLLLKRRLESNPRDRKDGVSTYLDRMDAVFHRDAK